MLYCPKCKSKYEDGIQRFCDNDGGRLLPAPTQVGSVKRGNKVFTNLLDRTAPSNKSDEKLAGSPRFVKVDRNEPNFEPPAKSRVFKPNTKFASTEQKIKLDKPNVTETSKRSDVKPAAKLIGSSEVSVSQASLGNRETSPSGRAAVTWQNPLVLLGETVKGRYRMAEKLHQDQASIAYLAEDGIEKGKRVVVRVLMSDTARDSFQDKVFSDERVSLSHINHPNIVRVIDSGELPEGKPFVVTDFIEGKSVGDILRRSGDLNSMRTARIVRQTSLALSEIHQSGVLHRNLKPEHMLLMVSEAGIEQVKVTDFAVSDGKPQIDNLAYKSPEQLGGDLPTFASDTYSVAVIAFQMLTGKLPFNDNSERGFLKAQRSGLRANVCDLKPDIPKGVDRIFVKALAFNPADRHSKTRDFGESLFDALTAGLPRDEEARFGEVETAVSAAETNASKTISVASVLDQKANVVETETPRVSSDIHISSSESVDLTEVLDTEEEERHETAKIETGEELWKNRSTEPVKERGFLWTILSLAGLLLLAVAAIWSVLYFINRDDQSVAIVQPTENESLESQKPPIESASKEKTDDDTPPPVRDITPPLNFKFFENTKDKLSPKLAKHYRGFSLYYPDGWVKTSSGTNFLDVKKANSDDFPEEQMLITHYDSGGTFSADKPKFPKLVEKSNNDLEGLIRNYKAGGEDEITVNGWKAYKVEFTGTVPQGDSEDIEIWGRRIWVPAARPGVRDGFVITMLATSLSESVEGLKDVGQKGDLGEILSTFKPSRDYEN